MHWESMIVNEGQRRPTILFYHIEKGVGVSVGCVQKVMVS